MWYESIFAGKWPDGICGIYRGCELDRKQQQIRATQLYVYTFAVFLVGQAIGIATGGAASQEPLEFFRPSAEYQAALQSAGDGLRIMLAVDLFFMIGYGAAISLTAALFFRVAPVMAWSAGIGILAVLAADLAENLTMLLSLDQIEAGGVLEPARIAWQAGISGLKWFLAAITLVALSLILPRETLLETTLVWLARITMPVGAALFVTGAFDQRLLGGMLILAGMGGGLAILALVLHLRTQRGV